ncbi:MAG: hypothetical protein AAFZ18_17855 [Myxococcota bacterium]
MDRTRRRLAWVVGAALFLGLGAPAQAAPAVDVTIEIMEASRTSKGFAGPTGRYAGQLKQLGFVGAKAIDKVTASGRSAGSKVELRFSGGRKIRVEVLSASPTSFRVELPDYRFSTKTTHKNGGVFLTVIPKDNLVLAVRPSK